MDNLVLQHDDSSVENVAIVGSGPAGWTAAIYAGRASLRPVVFEGALTAENQELGTLPMGQLATTTEIENYPGFPSGELCGYLNSALDEDRMAILPPEALENDGTKRSIYGPALVELMRRQALNFGTRVVEEDVVSIDLAKRPFKLTISDGTERLAKAIVIATGATARWLGLPSEERFKNNGVSACAVCDGALPRFAERPVVVVGGGDTALEDAEYLSKFASKVYVVHRRDSLRASKILESRARSNPKLEFVWNSVVAEILGDDVNGVTGARLKSVVEPSRPTYDLEASGIFVAIGRRPNISFLNGTLELTDGGYIKRVIPFRSNTSVPGVFVAGDVCDERYRQAIVASASGACAAIDAERFLAEES